MKKKEFLTEAKRKAIIADKEKAIIESFAKTFNKIKRIDENEINEFEEENPLYSRQEELGMNYEKDEDIQNIKNTPPDGAITDMIKQYGYDITYTFNSNDEAVAEVIIYGDNEGDDITYYFDVYGDDGFSRVGVNLSEDNKNEIGLNDFKFIENIIEEDSSLSDEYNRMASEDYLEKLDGDPYYDRHERFDDDF